MEENGELSVPPVPGLGFINDNTQIPWDSEILESFAQLTDITKITFHYFEDIKANVKYEVVVGKFFISHDHHIHRFPATNYISWYLWTKEGFKIQKKNIQI